MQSLPAADPCSSLATTCKDAHCKFCRHSGLGVSKSGLLKMDFDWLRQQALLAPHQFFRFAPVRSIQQPFNPALRPTHPIATNRLPLEALETINPTHTARFTFRSIDSRSIKSIWRFQVPRCELDLQIFYKTVMGTDEKCVGKFRPEKKEKYPREMIECANEKRWRRIHRWHTSSQFTFSAIDPFTGHAHLLTICLTTQFQAEKVRRRRCVLRRAERVLPA